MSNEIITDENWRGVPCTLRYNNSLKPVCGGDQFEGLKVIGGRAPHKANSSGYMSYEGHRETYVHGCHWVEDYEPNAWAVMLRTKRKGRRPEGQWEQDYSFSIDYHGDDRAYLMAHGRARLIEFDPALDCFVKAVEDPNHM